MAGFKWTWETAPQSPGAGIVVVQNFDKEYKVLGLWARGGYDIPKGHVESGEGFLDFKWGKRPIIVDQLKVYLAETSQPGKVVANEHSGILEHEYLKWMEWEEMYEKTYDYLKPAILWAKESVEKDESK